MDVACKIISFAFLFFFGYVFKIRICFVLIASFYLVFQVTAKANLSAATSDSAIQMMDRYHAHRICTGISITESFETDCGIAAATCLILSSKLHEIRPLSGIQQVQSLFLMVVTSYLIFPLFLYFFCVDCSQQPVFLTMKHNWFNLNVICFIFYALTLYHKLHLLCWYVK
jgi:hypothetical protein